MTLTSQSSQHEILRVSTGSSPTAVAGAVAGAIRHHGTAHVQVVGAGALNQAVKAVAIAQGYLGDDVVELVCVPHFTDIEIDGEARTAIRLEVEDRDHRIPGAATPTCITPAR